MSAIAHIPSPNLPSYECAKRGDLLDARFIRETDKVRFAHNRFNGAAMGGHDDYMAGADVDSLKGIGKARAKMLESVLGILTIGDLAGFGGDFVPSNVRLNSDYMRSVEVFRSLRTGLNSCTPTRAAPMSVEITMNNDPTLDVGFVAGKDKIAPGMGEAGAAVLKFSGTPANRGTMPSWLKMTVERDGDPIELVLGPGLPRSNAGVVRALLEKARTFNLDGDFSLDNRQGAGPPSTVVRLWSRD